MNFRNLFMGLVNTVVQVVDVEKVVAGLLYDKVANLDPSKKQEINEISKTVERVGEMVVATARGLNQMTAGQSFPDPIKDALKAWKDKLPTPDAYKQLFRS